MLDTKEKTVTMKKNWFGKTEEVQTTRNEYQVTWVGACQQGFTRIVDYSDADKCSYQLKKIQEFEKLISQLAGEQWDRDYKLEHEED